MGTLTQGTESGGAKTGLVGGNSGVECGNQALEMAMGEHPEMLRSQPFHYLEMTVEHAFRVDELPMYHRPFDRLVIAQCLVEGHTLVNPGWRYGALRHSDSQRLSNPPRCPRERGPP